MAKTGKNGKPTKKEDTAQRIINNMNAAHGLLTSVSKLTGIGYRTVCRYAAENAEVQEAIIQAKECALDYAESKLFTAIKKGSMTAIIFYLKTQGKKRGYIERQEVTGAEGAPITFTMKFDDNDST